MYPQSATTTHFVFESNGVNYSFRHNLDIPLPRSTMHNITLTPTPEGGAIYAWDYLEPVVNSVGEQILDAEGEPETTVHHGEHVLTAEEINAILTQTAVTSNLLNSNFPSSLMHERNGKLIYVVSDKGQTAQIDLPATVQNLAEVGLYERIDEPPTYDPSTQRIRATGEWVNGRRQYEVIDLTLEEIKDRKLEDINSAFEESLETGFDTGMGFSLSLRDGDRTSLAQNEQLVAKALSLGLMQPTDPLMLTDTEQVPHMIQAGQLEMLMLAYGQFYQGLWGKRATLRAGIKNAQTMGEVLAIEWS